MTTFLSRLENLCGIDITTIALRTLAVVAGLCILLPGGVVMLVPAVFCVALVTLYNF